MTKRKRRSQPFPKLPKDHIALIEMLVGIPEERRKIRALRTRLRFMEKLHAVLESIQPSGRKNKQMMEWTARRFLEGLTETEQGLLKKMMERKGGAR